MGDKKGIPRKKYKKKQSENKYGKRKKSGKKSMTVQSLKQKKGEL